MNGRELLLKTNLDSKALDFPVDFWLGHKVD
jgi:hypothetical protein